MKPFTAVALAAAALALTACDQIPAYRQMQAESAAKARITKLKAEGQAQLVQAESNRRIITLNAQARLDSAQMLANSEVIRASGVAKANAIIANGLGGPEGYLRWKYIEMLEENRTATTIYIPTEAGLPILEARRK
jgi:regulator of protease activity HflC (stomatin/prohibitin superfamily)